MSSHDRYVRAVLLPTLVTVVMPALIVAHTMHVRIGWSLPPPWTIVVVASGMLLITCGLSLVARTVRLCATRGQGTPAPWDPPRHLVVAGIYRHVRNP